MNAAWKDYINITKPRIVLSNLIAAFAGFWLASSWKIDWMLLIVTLLGSSLVMACSCVFNNLLDREMDVKMARTRNRPLASGRLQPRNVIIYGTILGLAGEAVLVMVNPLTALLGFVGILVYVVIYTAWLKRTSTWSTAVGGISGAMPPVIGYTAVTNEIDLGAVLLFAFLFCWQPPHFWALGIRRIEDYRAAGFPLLPVVKGIQRTKIQMIPYVVLMNVSTALLYAFGYTGLAFLFVTAAMGLTWLYYCIAGLKAKDDQKWAHNIFKFSVHYLTIVNIVMVLNTQ